LCKIFGRIACANDFSGLPVPVIWLNCLDAEDYASDVPLIWQNCLYVDSVPVIWQNYLDVEERASDVPVFWQNCLCK
jgi:hypothetical protein